MRAHSLKIRVVYAIIALAAAAAFSSLRASDERPYLGEWSNGRGETLKVTSSTLQFGSDKPVAYRDVTRATDGSDFELQITASGQVNAFPGKTLGLHCESDTMKMTGYASHAAYMQGGEVQMEVAWDRDSDEDEHSD
ncbi:MAG: hypothetical protein ABR526_04880 [Chthoniobacterales bacterium]